MDKNKTGTAKPARIRKTRSVTGMFPAGSRHASLASSRAESTDVLARFNGTNRLRICGEFSKGLLKQIKDLQKRLEGEQNDDVRSRKLEKLQDEVMTLDDFKDVFDDKIAARFAKTKKVSELWSRKCEHAINDNLAAKFGKIEGDAKVKFEDFDTQLQMLHASRRIRNSCSRTMPFGKSSAAEAAAKVIQIQARRK